VSNILLISILIELLSLVLGLGLAHLLIKKAMKNEK